MHNSNKSAEYNNSGYAVHPGFGIALPNRSDGGNGGGPGQAGSNGVGANGGTGGAAGNAIEKNGGALTWVNGGTSPNVEGAIV